MRRGLHEVDLNLQRTLRDQAQQLRLRLDLLRHEIQDHQFQRAHTLTLRFWLFKREDSFRIEDGSGRQAAGDLDRHSPYYGAGTDMERSPNGPTDIGNIDNALSDGGSRHQPITTRRLDIYSLIRKVDRVVTKTSRRGVEQLGSSLGS